MTTQIRFLPELGAWLTHNLAQGANADALVAAMRGQGMAAEVAQAITDAFVAARVAGEAAPVDTIELPQDAGAYVVEAPRISAGTTIKTFDRTVRIAARAERPALAVLNYLMDADECEQLIAFARGRLKPSTIVDPKTGRDIVAGQRSSYGMFFALGENPLVAKLDRRFAEIMNMPVEHGEGLQVLHYPKGAGSAPHFDFLVPSNAANRASIARSGQRVSTLVAYLNDVPGGGQTLFPEAGWAVSPQRGSAVAFEFCNSRGQLDHASLHASDPVIEGEKWVATKWMRQRPFISADQEGAGTSSSLRQVNVAAYEQSPAKSEAPIRLI